MTMQSLLLVFQFLQILLHHQVNGATVAGCDGHPCSTGHPSISPFDDQRDAVLFSHCHAACLDEVFKSGDQQREEIIEGTDAWPHLSLTHTLDANCIQLRKLVECRRGCIRKAREPFLKLRICRQKCKRDCVAECPTDCKYNNTECYFDCRIQEGCKLGCGITITLPHSNNNHPIIQPTSVPALERKPGPLPQPPGLFNLTQKHVPERNGSTVPSFSVFLFKIQSSSNDYYLIQTSLFNETLDLSYFACKDVDVSVAVVMKDRRSQFSPTRSLCIHGETRYPPQIPNNTINYTLSRDDRAGYGNNAVVDMSWLRPPEAHLITHYELIIFTQNRDCTSADTEQEKYRISETLFFEVKALSPNRLPKIDCIYQFTLQVFPIDPNATSQRSYGVIDIRDTSKFVQKLPLVVNCSSRNDEETGLISAQVEWHIPSSQDHIEGVTFYSVDYFWVISNSNHIKLRRIILINTNHSEDGSGSFIYDGLRANDTNMNITIKVEPHLSTNKTYQPKFSQCHLRVVPLPPVPVNSTSVAVTILNYQASLLQLNITWDEPTKPYGMILDYEVRMSWRDINGRPLTFTDKITNVVPGQVIDVTAPSTGMNYCPFVEVRAKNVYSWGNWSKPVPVPCDFLSSSALSHGSTIGLINQLPLPLSALVGIGIGVCVVLAICIVCTSICICLCRRHRMKVQMNRAFENGYSNPMIIAGGRHIQRHNSSLRTPFTMTHIDMELDEWEIPVGAVIVDTKFGEGCFGEVHRGVVKGPLPSSRTMKSNICVTVAIKMLKTCATGSERTDFLHEIETMKKIAQGNNPHVITFVGCVTVQEPLCLITEFIKYGDLLSYLETIRKLITHKNRQRRLANIAGLKEPEPYLEPQISQAAAVLVVRNEELEEVATRAIMPSPDSPYAPLGGVEPVNLISFAYQIASGMEYLSSLDIVHRDLACRNILIGENKNLKISDFGMSRIVTGDDIYVKTTKGRLPWKWMAIESIVNREFTHASDIWSYGVTLWEIATLGGFPYPMVSNAELLDHLKQGYRLDCPENCSPEIYKVMLECWSEDPCDRKTFPELRSLFDAMLAEDNPYIQFENINSHMPYYNTHSQRSSRCEDETVMTLSTSESETDMEVSSDSNVTINGASASGVYDFLRPIVEPVEAPATLDENAYTIQQAANPYVETPTCKFLVNQDSVELSNFELELQQMQESDEMESSGEIHVDINATANSVEIVE